MISLRPLRCIRRLVAGNSGATAVEFAMVMPVFLVMMFAAVETGEMFWTQVGLQYAVETAARCRAVNVVTCPSTDTTKTYASSKALGLTIPVADFTVTAPACGYQVAASFPFAVFVPLVYNGTINITAQSCHP